nr:terminase large subunit [uncultured Mediterranean phage uvMED]
MQNSEIITKLALDPVLFVESMLDCKPEAWQKEVLESLLSDDKIAIKSGHGTGKTALLSWIILWWLCTKIPTKIACTANSAHQLNDVLWSEISKWHRNLPDGFKNLFEFKSDKINLVGVKDSFAVARTARREQPEALQGFHSPNMLFIADEASGIDNIIFEVAEGSLSTKGAKVILTGNPTRSSGYFYDCFHTMKHRWKTFTVSCHDSQYVNPSFIADMAKKYGEDSNVFRIRVLGEFPESNDDAIIPLHLISEATTRDIDPSTDDVIWGLDVARHGNDRTALAKRQGNTLLEKIKTWKNKDLMETVGIVVSEYEALPYSKRPTEILIDSIGLGAGVADRLQEMNLNCQITAVNVAELPSMQDKYMRLRDELWFLVREWFESRDVKIIDDEELIAELTTPSFSFMSNGKIKVESKEQMKKKGHNSPDLADALCLTFASRHGFAKSNKNYKWNRPIERNLSWIV